MNSLTRMALRLGQKVARRLKEREGLVSGFADLDMHQWMLSYESRNEAFDRAIRAAVRDGAVVADVGAGTGLLSMMACRAGAARVYALESRPIIELARKVARENGYQDRIVFVQGESRRVTLPERVDVVVSETIGAFVFSEDLVPTMVDARDRFLKPQGVMIPQAVKVHIAPVESFREGIGFWERPVSGFDYRSAAQAVEVSRLPAARGIGPRDFLAEPQVLYDVDLMKVTGAFDFSRRVTFTARRAGALHGFVGFWDARLFDDITLRCEPGVPDQQWVPVLFRLRETLALEKGDGFRLSFGRRDLPGWIWAWDVERA